MKIVFPTNSRNGLNDQIADHFGRCLTYTFLNEKGEVIEIVDNIGEHMGGSILPPELMKEHGADVLICHDLGPRALNLCQDLGIEVYICRDETVKDCLKLWQSNKLEKAGLEDVCEEHKKI
ncbi:NifB/NifX family molybdenum-iron cluster-binding protein [Candidatus Falkowbacteria bacterium]|nr:NifB/NifX family molybdenum-iron cluster-binding protein [Candidatus Falkowbacteria bacterium]